MRKCRNIQLGEESREDAISAGRFNPSRAVTYRSRQGEFTCLIGAGLMDHVSCFREGEELIVLSLNQRLNYCGIEIFIGDEKTADVFLQGEEVENLIGDINSLLPGTIARRLYHLAY